MLPSTLLISSLILTDSSLLFPPYNLEYILFGTFSLFVEWKNKGFLFQRQIFSFGPFLQDSWRNSFLLNMKHQIDKKFSEQHFCLQWMSNFQWIIYWANWGHFSTFTQQTSTSWFSLPETICQISVWDTCKSRIAKRSLQALHKMFSCEKAYKIKLHQKDDSLSISQKTPTFYMDLNFGLYRFLWK